MMDHAHISRLAANVDRFQRVFMRCLWIADTPTDHFELARDALAAAEKEYREAIAGLSGEEIKGLRLQAAF
jgi:hypothetical protein